MLKDIKRFIRNNEFSLNLWDHFICINNYSNIILLDDNRIILDINGNIISIIGNNLSINRLLDNEILIDGDFKSIKLGE